MPAPGTFSFGSSATSSSAQPSSSKTRPFSFAPSTSSSPLFASKSADNTRANGHHDDEAMSSVLPDDEGDTLYLEPSSFPRSGRAKWKASGRTMLASVCPVGGEVATYTSRTPSADDDKASTPLAALTIPDKHLLFASSHSLPQPLLGFYTEAYTLFTSLQRIVASSFRMPSLGAAADVWDTKGKLMDVLGPPGAETVGHMRRLVGMYLEELVKLREIRELDPEVKVRYDAVYHIFHLAQILYLPQDGRGEGLLGEELLDWVNDVDPAPDNSQGNEIMQTKHPWDHPSFFPYISRCLLRGFHLPASSFLRTLSAHPHPPISRLASLIASHLSLFPRSHDTTSYPLDHQFLTAYRSWLARFRAEIASMTGGGGTKGRGLLGEGSEKGGKWNKWEEEMRVVVELVEGKAERVLNEAADWREALGAWGVLVDQGLRRDDLPAVIKRIVERIPLDATLLDDSVHSSLCSGRIVKALTFCHELDTWLSAHLSDVFDKLALIPDDEESFDMSLRDYFLLEYAELLQENPGGGAMWRVVADYLAAAGEEGRGRLREHILRIGLGLDKGKGQEREDAGMDVEELDTSGEPKGEADLETQLRRFAELREACEELKLGDEWRTISKVVADRLVRSGQLGLAATMCLQGEDGYGLSRIAEKILDAYVEEGDESFLRLVDSLPPSLLNEAPLRLSELAQLDSSMSGSLPFDLPDQTAASVFASRLAFLSEFRDYLLFLGQGARDAAASRLVGLLTSGIAPVGFWAVLLAESVGLLEDAEILFSSNDTFELLRVLEDVMSNASFAPDQYLEQLAAYLRRQATTEEVVAVVEKGYGGALRKMAEIRLALARNLARALVGGFDHPF